MSDPEPNNDILRCVGGALSNWSLVELQLSTLFCTISKMPNRSANALFDGIISFDVRLGICDRLMALEKVNEIEAEMWTRLSQRLSKFYKKRHELAHFSLMPNEKGQPRIMPFMTFDKIFSEKGKMLSTVEIKERMTKFIELHMALGWFNRRAIQRYSTPQQGQLPDPAEPPLVPLLRDAAIQILEERKQQQSRQRS